MARVNITLPDHLYGAARAAGLNISRLAAGAVADELDRRSKIAALDALLDDLERECGPIPESEQAQAQAWADAVLPPLGTEASAV
jgi:hypothetical protein